MAGLLLTPRSAVCVVLSGRCLLWCSHLLWGTWQGRGWKHRASQRGVCVCLLGWDRAQQAVCAVVDAIILVDMNATILVDMKVQ